MTGIGIKSFPEYESRGKLKSRKERNRFTVLYGWEEAKRFVFNTLVGRLPRQLPKAAKAPNQKAKAPRPKIEDPSPIFRPKKGSIEEAQLKGRVVVEDAVAKKYLGLSEDAFGQFKFKHFGRCVNLAGKSRYWPVEFLKACKCRPAADKKVA